ncbi:MAG: NADPH-dependent glutamate synthase [Clostridia bacterium]|nr:NADPH-dependent glutamate synthase [Clostridia bacterium]
MPNMINQKTNMPVQDPHIRNKNFDEVALGYSDDDALFEAQRCLNCKHMPCVSGCPVNVQIPDFISLICQGDIKGAYNKIKETNYLPDICGRVCPQETQCEQKCVRGIKGQPVGIGRLERYVADWYSQNCKDEIAKIPSNGHKVAVIGSGPSGLTCAADLAKKGYEVTIFEALHEAGGVLIYGIPEFRLPKAIVKKCITQLEALGVVVKKDMVIGQVLSIDELMDSGFEAVYVSTGAGLPNFMRIPGESLVGVYSANEFLTRINLMKAYKPDYDTPIAKIKNAAIVGGGNVAMDAARCAKRLGAENVYIVYRRSEEEMPARNEEIEHAKEEDIIFKVLNNPVELIGDENGRVSKMKCIKMQLGEPDSSGRRRPVPVENSEFCLDVDCVIIAIGNSPNPLIRTTTKGIEANKKGCLIVDDDLQTTRSGVYAGGDAVTGAATVILAMGAGKKAAASIDKMLK